MKKFGEIRKKNYLCNAVRYKVIEIKEAPHGEELYPGRDVPSNKSLNVMVTRKTISFALFLGLIKFRIEKTYKK